jgi:hypothetical protein
MQVSNELGHSRIDVTDTYLGSEQDLFRQTR